MRTLSISVREKPVQNQARTDRGAEGSSSGAFENSERGSEKDMMAYTDAPRPCVVNRSRALFHGWAEIEKPNIEDGKQVGRWKNTVALIEYQNGSVEPISPSKVRFLDGAKVFSQYDWGDADA